MNNIWNNLEKPFLVLAPMAGYTDAAFRLLCREYGADLVMTELISADAIAYSKFVVEDLDIEIDNDKLSYVKVTSGKNHNTAEMLSHFKEERPLIVQLFGKYPEKFALAASWIDKNLKVDGIDINMGCPARKVVGSDHGAALLKNVDLATDIVKAVKDNTSLPVSVKTRLGWDNDDQILEFAPKLVEAGVSAITIHGRTYRDGFGGISRWSNIFEVKKMFGDKIAVIGNGDLKQESILNKMQNEVRLDGLATGRASFGNPWVFCGKKETFVNCETNNDSDEFVLKSKISDVVARHSELLFASKGSKGLIEFRKHLLCYLRGFTTAKELRLEAVKVNDLNDIEKILNKLK